MATTPAHEGTILVGTDGSERAQRAVAWAAHEAAMRGSRLTILTAWTAEHLADATLWAVGYSGSKLLEDIRAEQLVAATGLVEKAARSVRDRHPDLDIHTVAHEGDARQALVEYGRDAALVVVGSRGNGPIASVVLGSVAFWLTRHCEVPLAVVPTDAEHRHDLAQHRGVVVGVDFDPLCAKVVAMAAHEADERMCDLVLTYCAWDGDASRQGWEQVAGSELHSVGVDIVERLASATKARYPHLTVRRRFARGAVDRYLADIGSTHEMLVLGRRASSPLDLVGAGSIATAVFHNVSCVVMVVPLSSADDEAVTAEGEALQARAG